MKKNKKLVNRRAVVASGLLAAGTSLLFSCKDKSENSITLIIGSLYLIGEVLNLN